VTQIQEIEQAIAKLPRKEFFELVRHLRERHAREWDQQIEEDAQSGKLREVYRRLESENQGQPDLPLDDFLDDEKLSWPVPSFICGKKPRSSGSKKWR